MEELVANINNESGGVVQASMNDDGKLVLSNDTGATIQVIVGAMMAPIGGSGLFDARHNGANRVQHTFGGFLKLDLMMSQRRSLREAMLALQLQARRC